MEKMAKFHCKINLDYVHVFPSDQINILGNVLLNKK